MAGLFTLGLAYILSQFYRSFLAVLAPALSSELGATNADLALASGMWFLTFALMQFAVGVGLDRYGPRYTASLLLAIAGGGGIFLFAAAHTPMMIIIAMGLIGIGCSPILMGSLYIFARTYSPARFAFLTSAFIAIGNLGNIFGASPLAFALETFGWRNTVSVIGFATMVVAAAIFVLVRDPAKEDGAGSSGLSGYLELLRIKQLWLIFPVMLLIYSAAAGIRGLWAGPYLSDVYNLDTLQIGEVTLFMAIAMAVGSLVYGPLDSLFKTRKWVVFAGGVLSVGALVYLAGSSNLSIYAVTAAMIVIGLSGMSYGVIMAHGKAFFPKHLIGRGVTLMNFFAIGGVALMQILTGWVFSTHSSFDVPASGYTNVFIFYAFVVGGALVIYLFSRDAKPRP